MLRDEGLGDDRLALDSVKSREMSLDVCSGEGLLC